MYSYRYVFQSPDVVCIYIEGDKKSYYHKDDIPIMTIERILPEFHKHHRYVVSWDNKIKNYETFRNRYGRYDVNFYRLFSEDPILNFFKTCKMPEYEKVHISGSKKKITFYLNNQYVSFVAHDVDTPKFIEKSILYSHYGALIEHCLRLNKTFSGDVSIEQWNKWNEALALRAPCESLLGIEEQHISIADIYSATEEINILLG